MKKGQLFLIVALLLFLIPLPRTGNCYLDDYSTNRVFSTQFFGYTDYFNRSHFDPNLILRYRLDSIGDNENVKLDFYGKVWGSFTSKDEDAYGKLYNFFLDFKRIVPHTNLRLGRNFFYTTAGSGIIDGLKIDYIRSGSFGLSFSGGRDVIFSETGEFTKSGDYALAISGYLMKFSGTNLDLSYYQKYDENDLAKEIIALKFDQRLSSNADFYLESTFDIISEVFNLVQTGINFDPTEKLFTTLEYYRTIPTFDSTSIYSVFAVDEFQRFQLRGRYTFSPKVRVDLVLANLDYSSGSDANTLETDIRIYPSKVVSLYGQIIFRDGTGGDIIGFAANGDWQVQEKTLLNAGIQVDDYEREDMISTGTATRLWAGGRYEISDRTRVSLRVEDNINENFNNDVRARLDFNITF